MNSAEHKAVFLSYASQDAEAAKKICEALRAAGVEVWFDKSELRGGDAWDQKIRRQIRDCVLFLPVISAATQARREGYFRLEWKLADDRTHLMAKGTPFLVPVCVDETKDWDALVPDSFMNVQWTRLPGGETPTKFAERVVQLLDGGSTSPLEPGRPRPGQRDEGVASPAGPMRSEKKFPRWMLALGAAVVIGAGLFLALRPKPTTALAATVAPASAARAVAATTSAEFPRDPDLKRARKLLFSLDSIPEDFALADDIIKPILAQRPNDPEVVTMAAEVTVEFVVRGFDLTEARRASAQRLAERAVAPAPENPAALAALGRYLLYLNSQVPRAEELVRRATQLDPREPRFARTLYQILTRAKAPAEAEAYAAQMVAQYPDDALVRYDIARMFKDANNGPESERWFDEALARAPIATATVWKAWLALEVHGDVAAMKTWLDRVSERQRANTRVVHALTVHARITGQTAEAIKRLNDLTDPWLTDFDFSGPKALLIGELLQIDGRPELAQVQLEQALALIRQEKARSPTDVRLLRPEVWTLLLLGRNDEARVSLRLLHQALVRPYFFGLNVSWWTGAIRADLLVGERDSALTLLKETCHDPQSRLILRNMLRIDPRMAPFRDDPEITALIAEPKTATPAALSVASSPARELADKARALIQGIDATREDFALAEDFCQRALKLDSSDGEVWAAYSQVDAAFGYRGWDTTPERREQTRVMAERAIRLAPTSVQARLAQAGAWAAFGINRPETEKLLRDIVAERPDDQAALRFLAVTVLNRGGLDECLTLNERSAALPGGDPLALFNNARYLWTRGRRAEAYALIERSLAQKSSFGSALVFKTTMELFWRGDLAAAEATLQKIPQSALMEDRASFTAGLVHYYQRRADAALAAWGAFPRDYFVDFAYDGPKGLLLGLADELDHRDAAAKIEWRTALAAVEKRIAATPNNPVPYYYKAYLLACLSEKVAAAETLATHEQLARIKFTAESPMSFDLALVYTRLGRFDDFFAYPPSVGLGRVKIDPRFDTLRADPRYEKLLAENQRRQAEAKK